MRSRRCERERVVPRASARPDEGGTDVTRAPRSVHLHSRQHIDLQRVAGALCCS
ncbi:putative leader peptide [Streptomyces sp. NPDC059582]|uniref:putative leader peptide n=1 Tax=Streptomyces sp. NPDC059582 TaxID=3346875 RepID=UPI0036C5188D